MYMQQLPLIRMHAHGMHIILMQNFNFAKLKFLLPWFVLKMVENFFQEKKTCTSTVHMRVCVCVFLVLVCTYNLCVYMCMCQCWSYT